MILTLNYHIRSLFQKIIRRNKRSLHKRILIRGHSLLNFIFVPLNQMNAKGNRNHSTAFHFYF